MRRIALALVVPVLLAPVTSSGKGRVQGEPAVATTELPASKEQVYQALLETLSTWKMRKASLEEGIIKTEWVQRQRMDETFRGRIVAEFASQGYGTLLTVRHERQRKMDEMRPTIGGPAAEWRDWDGIDELVRDVVRSVEQAVGVVDPGTPISQVGASRAERGPEVVVQGPDCIVSPAVGARVNELRLRRKDLVKEVRALDQRILDAVYGGNYEQIKGDVDTLKTRKAALEGQITEVDKEILALVLQG